MVVAMVDELELFKLSEQKRVDLAYYTKNPEILKVLAGDPDGYIRQGVSVNPNTPAGTLTVLAADVNDNIRNYVAANPNKIGRAHV